MQAGYLSLGSAVSQKLERMAAPDPRSRRGGVIAMEDQRRYVELLEVFSGVRLSRR